MKYTTELFFILTLTILGTAAIKYMGVLEREERRARLKEFNSFFEEQTRAEEYEQALAENEPVDE